MRAIGVFVHTNIANRILSIANSGREEGRLYLSKIVEQYVRGGIVRLIVNPTVKQEIESTPDLQKRKRLLVIFNQFHFTSYNKTIFPFVFPATFITPERGENIGSTL